MRIKGGVHTRSRRVRLFKKVKGYRMAKSRRFRHAVEQLMKSGRFAYRHRRNRKREFRSLWIERINAAARLHGLTYGRLIHGLSVARVGLDRKMLSEIAVRDPEAFAQLAALVGAKAA